MSIVFEQVLLLFFFAAVGYALAKGGIVRSEHATVLSKLLVWVFLPASVVQTFSSQCTVHYLSTKYTLILWSIGVLAVISVGMFLLSHLLTKQKSDRKVYEYSMVVANVGYMGYALIAAVFGENALMDAMIFAMPMSLYVYTYGYCLLTGSDFSPRRLVNPMTVALLVGMILGLSGLGAHLPSVCMGFLSKAGACMGPVSMLLVGIVVSEFRMHHLLTNGRLYIVVLVRLLLVPLTVGIALRPFVSHDLLRVAVALYAMPCGLNTVVFVRNAGGDCKNGAGLALLSTVFACLSVPFVLWALGLVS